MVKENFDNRSLTAEVIDKNQWLFYPPLVFGKTASFGGDIGGLGAVLPAGPGAHPLVRGSGGEAPQKLKAFCFTFFSEARAEIKRFDRF